jgi:hypothetical protein
MYLRLLMRGSLRPKRATILRGSGSFGRRTHKRQPATDTRSQDIPKQPRDTPRNDRRRRYGKNAQTWR